MSIELQSLKKLAGLKDTKVIQIFLMEANQPITSRVQGRRGNGQSL